MTTRRACLGLAGLLGSGVSFGARAQAKAKPARVALVFNWTPLADMAGADPASPYARAIVHGLRDLGYVEGRDIVVERRSAEGNYERLPALMREVVGLPVDVIVTVGVGATAAARATSTIPVVASIDDPVELGLTSSLARPSGNVTGVTEAADVTIHGKRLQLLKEIAPQTTRVAVIDHKYVDPRATPGVHLRRRELESTAAGLGVTLVPVALESRGELEQAFATVARERVDALLEMNTVVTMANRQSIVDFAARRRLPAIFSSREFADAGGLASYGPSLPPLFARLSVFVDKILKGAAVADLPFEHPTQYELIVNLKTAKALGLAVPRPVLLRASEILQ